MVLQQQAELFAVIRSKQIGAGEGGLVAARLGHKAVAQACAIAACLQRARLGVDAHKRVKRPHTLLKVGTGHKLAHGMAQVVKAGLVQRLYLGKCTVGVGVTGGGDERWANTHGVMLSVRYDGISMGEIT